VESFNGKLRDELINREIFTTLLEAKMLIENWRRDYNEVRPHSSLGYRPPAPEAIQAAPNPSASNSKGGIITGGRSPTLSIICDIYDPLTKQPYTRDPRYIAQKAEKYLISTASLIPVTGVPKWSFSSLMTSGLIRINIVAFTT